MEIKGIFGLGSVRRAAPNLVIIFSVAGLTVLGLIVLFSATHGIHADPYAIIRKQAVWLLIALAAGAVAAWVDWERMRFLAWPIAGLTAGLLVLVLIEGIGVSVNGARRWLDLGLMRMQVSDFAKIAFVFVLAHYLAANQRRVRSFRSGFCLPCAIIAAVFFLILLEPDFGTAFLVGLIGGAMLFLAGVRLVYLVPSSLLGIGICAVAVVCDPVRLKRITSFLNVEANKADGAYQLWQGILAFGAGGLRGVGLGNGRQQNAFLPEAHTDFIFSVIGEELGFFFTAGVVGLFLLVFTVGVWNLRRAPDMFQYLLVAGALLLISVQALLNLGVVTGCLPTKGLSLPFLSYGGSNLVCMFILVGIVLNGFRRWSRPYNLEPFKI